ncbi:MAG: methyltransferase domain-containing protein [Kofleriaceae bacterium]
METRDNVRNYFAWQAQLFQEFARGVIIDHGSGTGGLADALLTAQAGRVTAVEPDEQLVGVLQRRFANDPNAEVFPGTLDGYLAAHGGASVDAIVSSNVLEHIDDDVACLRIMHELLRPGGGVGLYLPARPELYGSLDEEVGHFRRYTRSDLVAKLERVGFRVQRVGYCNLVSVVPWIVTGRVLRRRKIGAGSLQLFDRVVFPVTRRLEAWFPPPYGLNLVAIGVK